MVTAQPSSNINHEGPVVPANLPNEELFAPDLQAPQDHMVARPRLADQEPLVRGYQAVEIRDRSCQVLRPGSKLHACTVSKVGVMMREK